mgnify:CR=1 FL=1
MSANISTLSKISFKPAISTATPTLVDFWAPWCGPCKALAPILEELAGELAGKVQIAKLNVDEEDAVAAEYGIRAIPALLLFKDGKVVDQFVGVQPKAVLKEKILAKI